MQDLASAVRRARQQQDTFASSHDANVEYLRRFEVAPRMNEILARLLRDRPDDALEALELAFRQLSSHNVSGVSYKQSPPRSRPSSATSFVDRPPARTVGSKTTPATNATPTPATTKGKEEEEGSNPLGHGEDDAVLHDVERVAADWGSGGRGGDVERRTR